MDRQWEYRDYLREELRRDRSGAVVGCALAAGAFGGLHAWGAGANADATSLIVFLSAALGGVIRHHAGKTKKERLQRELDQL